MSVGAKERQVGSITVLELSGRLTAGEVGNALDEKLQSLIASGRLALLLDCRHVIALDSWGMRALVRGLVSARKHGGDLKLLRISPQVRQVLDFARLLTVFETYDDEEAAVASFASPRVVKVKTVSEEAERRRSQRVRLIIQVETLGPGADTIGRTEDISVGGLLMVSPETLKPNTEVTVRFNLPPIPPGRPIEGQGVVRRAQSGGKMGIEFLLLKDEDRRAIAEFIQRGSPSWTNSATG